MTEDDDRGDDDSGDVVAVVAVVALVVASAELSALMATLSLHDTKAKAVVSLKYQHMAVSLGSTTAVVHEPAGNSSYFITVIPN